VHRKEKDGDENIIWKCNDYKQFTCHGRVLTRNDTIIKYVEYNHAPDVSKLKCREYIKMI
jgi:hypothetical protein